jgi:hypothetical protein
VRHGWFPASWGQFWAKAWLIKDVIFFCEAWSFPHLTFLTTADWRYFFKMASLPNRIFLCHYSLNNTV